jgi:tRNA dimethylallyltransferase
VCIAGPTASGKSALALAYARDLQNKGLTSEIICVDSATIYQGMDIGTAKPSPDELAIAPHHLINIRAPEESYSAGEFTRDALRLIGEIHNRGAQPVLVGGTMLYFKALLEGMDDLPTADLAVRAALDEEAKSQGWPALHAQLHAVDPLTAQRLNPNDSQRIGRALEVLRTTGQTLSSYFTRSDKSANANANALRSTPALAYKLIALEPQSRQWLHDRIAARWQSMCSQGLVDEVIALKTHANLTPKMPSMRCVGYRQIWQWLDGACSELEMHERGLAATRQLAKRQLTWLRSWDGKTSIAAETAGLAQLLAVLNTRGHS